MLDIIYRWKWKNKSQIDDRGDVIEIGWSVGVKEIF